MTRRRPPALVALAALIAAPGCVHVTAAVHTNPELSRELWYVKSTTIMGLPIATSVYYCPDVSATPANCTEATFADSPGHAEPESTSQAPVATVSVVDADLAKAFWNAASAGVEGDEVCAGVSSLLSRDEACAGEQCRAPVMLSALFLAKCKDAKEQVDAVKHLREVWRKQASGDVTDCTKALFRVARARSAEVAQNYKSACLSSREPSNVENAVLATVK